ncbi:hypothetical protein C6I20_13075 [Aeromicrobium sp. A1-2]|uniref:hypothetical protein n=1 Tax=Aeromicrobium sp. A1-2 TaxID=2107713 RepID=UPI000E5496FF|nr:hypothetical protein [Aeromicrobium sp. A1-2]AXT86025.1 hypothetical protein C6I20_13075 [Aeromicrobium sp. A1-2]
MNIGMPARRLLVALALPVALLAACSDGGQSVPDDQRLKPAGAPTGWQASDLDLVSIAAPPTWKRAAATTPEAGTTITTWSTPPVDGKSTSGMEVREITSPNNDAATAAKALGVNAMTTMQGGKPDPKEIVWPEAVNAWILTNDITVGPTAEERDKFASVSFVADLADGRQVQVLAFNKKGLDDALLLKVLSTVELVQVDQ